MVTSHSIEYFAKAGGRPVTLYKIILMKEQEVITIFSDVPDKGGVRAYPELDEKLNQGMHIEHVAQSQVGAKFVITFVLRHHYGSPQIEHKE